MRLRLALVLLALASLTAHAAEAPGFKGATLGSSNRLIAQDPRFDCRVVVTPTADQVCHLRVKERETIAAVPVVSLYYFYDQAQLTGITLSVDARYFQTVADALRAKYGEPKVVSAQVKNFQGEGFEDRTLTWSRPDGLIQMQRYAGRLDRSTLRISDVSAADRIARRRAAARDVAKDL